MTAPHGLAYLIALTRRRQNVYAGTASPNEVARRRAKSKVARRSRRINRSR